MIEQTTFDAGNPRPSVDERILDTDFSSLKVRNFTTTARTTQVVRVFFADLRGLSAAFLKANFIQA